MSQSRSIEEILLQGFCELGLSLEPSKFEAYLRLLEKWNHAYNLTAIRNIEEMIPRHLFDSLGILPYIKGPRVIDVGTGAGLPGVPLAIANPNLQITLLDSNGKKTRFLTEVKRILALENVTIVHDRIENFHPKEGFDTVTSRAFSDLKTFIQLTAPLISPQGTWLAMKGEQVLAEVSDIKKPYEIRHYAIPGTAKKQNCVLIQN